MVEAVLGVSCRMRAAHQADWPTEGFEKVKLSYSWRVELASAPFPQPRLSSTSTWQRGSSPTYSTLFEAKFSQTLDLFLFACAAILRIIWHHPTGSRPAGSKGYKKRSITALTSYRIAHMAFQIGRTPYQKYHWQLLLIARSTATESGFRDPC